MEPKYSIGQRVRIKPADSQDTSPRDCAIDEYAGQVGKVTNYYWVSPHDSEIFYIYVVRIGSAHKEIVLYEDEMEPHLSD